MPELVLWVYMWMRGDVLCATGEAERIPPWVDTITVKRIVLPEEMSPEQRAMVIKQRELWLKVHQCPRDEREI